MYKHTKSQFLTLRMVSALSWLVIHNHIFETFLHPTIVFIFIIIKTLVNEIIL